MSMKTWKIIRVFFLHYDLVVVVVVGRTHGGLIAHPQLLVQVIYKHLLPAWGTFRIGLASESHWLQPVLVLTIYRWPAPVSVGGLLHTRSTRRIYSLYRS